MSIGIIAKRGNSGPAKCPTCGGKGRVNLRQWGGKRGSGPPCTDCNGTGIDYGTHRGAGEIDDPSDPNIWLAEPMDLAFRLLKFNPGVYDQPGLGDVRATLDRDALGLDSEMGAEEPEEMEEPPERELSLQDRVERIENLLAGDKDRFNSYGQKWLSNKRKNRDDKGNTRDVALPREKVDLFE